MAVRRNDKRLRARRDVRRWMACTAGQGTVEFAIAMPVLLAIAAIGLNVMIFLGDCAAFDRVFRQAVRTYATSPAYGQTAEASTGSIGAALQEAFSREGLSTAVSCERVSGDKLAFTGTLTYSPTFFGYQLDVSFLGVRLPEATHSNRFVVDVYNPGVVI